MRVGRWCDNRDFPKKVQTYTRKGQISVGAGVPLVRGETSCSLWVVHQRKSLAVAQEVRFSSSGDVVLQTPVDMQAVEAANMSECGNVEMAAGVSPEGRGLQTYFSKASIFLTMNVYF